jgi:hypothetical protein
MAGQEFRPRSFYPQAWARPLFLSEAQSPNKSELVPVPHGTPWSWIGQSLLCPSLSLYVPLAKEFLRGLSHILWGLRCNERIRALKV